MDTETARKQMVARQIRARGVRDPRILAAMEDVPREAFLPPELAEFAYEDRPLPIEAGQTISQPYIVAVMAEALKLRPDDEVLEIGTGSGYAAAVLARAARHIYTIERIAELADVARERLAELGFTNVEVRCSDGTLGWPEHAPYNAIVVAAGGPDLPPALLGQLAIGGRLVMPVGTSRAQDLVRITRISETEYRREDLGGVQFVPLIGEGGWPEPEKARRGPLIAPAPATRRGSIARLVAECAEPIPRIDEVHLDSLLDHIGDARVVLLGEATHGTSEFYRMRARITQELVLRKGFTALAVEADWPDAATLDCYVRDVRPRPRRWVPFTRFPTWMWRNAETQMLIEWLRAYNGEVAAPERKVSFSGLDLYSMYISAYEVIRYLDRVDPEAAKAARERYGCLTPWQDDPAAYGRAALSGRMASCEREIVKMLRELLAKRIEYSRQDGDDFFDAAQNARVVAGAEHYYRAMYYGHVDSWNLRDQHMFETLQSILAHRGPDSKIIVWEHNSHFGDAAATEMAVRGEFNVGHLCRTTYGDGVYIVGFGTDHGTVAAADNWDEPMQVMRVQSSRPDSYERIAHDSGVPAFLLHLRDPHRDELREELADPRLERAIGVVYRPATELQSHYFQAVLPEQFDEYIWFDESEAVQPLSLPEVAAAEAHPLAP
jgi:protein-L-isoaspartate(D-aspartate) O-methyltransferase